MVASCRRRPRACMRLKTNRQFLSGRAPGPVTRHSANVRVHARPEGKKTVNFWPNNIYSRKGIRGFAELQQMRERVCGPRNRGRCNGHPPGEAYHQLEVTRYELLKGSAHAAGWK